MAMAEGRPILSVRELTAYIKGLLERDLQLAAVWVRGEISNFKAHTSGHLYFTVKDEFSQIKCVMFRGRAAKLRFRPESGMQVLLHGSVALFERDGAYQLYCTEMEPAGVGALHLQFEQLKARLAAEGLFDQALKRPLPVLPRRIGLVTAPTGAALRDMITVSQRRFPGIQILLAPALVQGSEAPASLLRAMELICAQPGIEVLIIGRGGGSLEDLWAFNDERVARAIRSFPVPVVSAVGHETDYTIADFVADLRAPTPSAAAEIVVPSRADLKAQVDAWRARLVTRMRQVVDRKRLHLKGFSDRPVLQRPQGRLLQDRGRLDELVRRLGFAAGKRMEAMRQGLAVTGGQLEALSPLAVLGRGYSIARTAEGGIIREAEAVSLGELVTVMLHKGELYCRIEGKQGGSTEDGTAAKL